MFVECRFCLEEIEVEFPKDERIEEEEEETGSCNSNQKENTVNQYLELIPVNQRKRKNDLGHRLVQPCDCKGTQRHVHVKCLCEWIGKSNKWYCSICARVYGLSPQQIHYCVMKLQRKGVLKTLPPLYNTSEFSRSSYLALLIFMGTISMLMLPSSLNNNNNNKSSISTTINTNTYHPSFSILTQQTTSYSNNNLVNPNYLNSVNKPNSKSNNNNYIYPSSSSPAIYSPTGKFVPSHSTISSTTTPPPTVDSISLEHNLPFYNSPQDSFLCHPSAQYRLTQLQQQKKLIQNSRLNKYPKIPLKESLQNIFCTFFPIETICG